MQLLVNEDTTTLSYWLNWRVFLCALWVFPAMFVSTFIIWKYESGRHQVLDAAVWKPCLREMHPVWLMAFRIIAFCLLTVALIFDVAAHGAELFFYYTQWTLTLVTVYFGFGSLLSIYGCYKYHKSSSSFNDLVAMDEERGLCVHLTHGGDVNGARPVAGEQAKCWGYCFQVLFQMTAGAVMITDILYWSIIFPFLTIKDYEMNFMTVIAHSLNAILLLGDTALNCLEFPWFRIAYFILLTGVYVIFEWIVHACVSMWWPYPFLDLSAPYAPFWYFSVAFMHIPCYAVFAFLVKAKHYLLSRWFPHSYELLR